MSKKCQKIGYGMAKELGMAVVWPKKRILKHGSHTPNTVYLSNITWPTVNIFEYNKFYLIYTPVHNDKLPKSL